MKQSMQVLTSQTTQEWYTPPWLIEMARTFMGSIDYDPASCETAQGWIQATTYGTKEPGNSGLDKMVWGGNVWLNPPFDAARVWVSAIEHQYKMGYIQQGILLVNSAHGYKWYEKLWSSYPVCCLTERVKFVREDGTIGGAAKRGQTLVYLGPNNLGFNVFSTVGRVLFPDLDKWIRRAGGGDTAYTK